MTQNANISISGFFSIFVTKSSVKFFAFLFFYAFWVITFVIIKILTHLEPQNDYLLSFVKDENLVDEY